MAGQYKYEDFDATIALNIARAITQEQPLSQLWLWSKPQHQLFSDRQAANSR